MKKRISVIFVLLSMVMAMISLPVFAAEQPAWSEIYRHFVLDAGFMESGKAFGYTESGTPPETYYDHVRFGLHDLNGDGIPELIAYRGAVARGEQAKYVYTFSNDQLEFLGNFGAYEGDCLYVPSSSYTGLFDEWMQMGTGAADYITYEDGQYQEITVYEWHLLDERYADSRQYEQKTSDGALYQTARNVIQAYNDAGYNAQNSNYPYVLPVYTVSEIDSMGWEAFIDEFETRNDKLISGPKYRINRIDNSFTLQGTSRNFESVNFYDCVEILQANSDALNAINGTLKTAADQYLSENAANTDFDWENGPPSNAYFSCYVENQSVYLTNDLISICNLETHFNGGDGGGNCYYCFNYDITNGEIITLPKYLGLSEEETREQVKKAVIEAGYQGGDYYFQNTAIDDYKFYIDYSGSVHAVFNTGEVADHATSYVDVLMDFTPKPQIIDQTSNLEESTEDKIILSVHCYGTDLDYEWEYSDDDGSQWTPTDGAEPVLTISKDDAVEGRLYRCTVTNEAGSDTSDPIKIPAELSASSEVSETNEESVGLDKQAILWIAAAAAFVFLLVLLFLILWSRGKKRSKSEKMDSNLKTDELLRVQPKSGSKFCGRCGTPRKGDEAFCTNCGNPLKK